MVVDPSADRVTVRGRAVRPPDESIYLLLNKPTGYLVSARDPHHSRTVYDLLKSVPRRTFPVGRLDLDTCGVLLLTDDGELSFRLTHPRFGVEKAYRAQVRGAPSRRALRTLETGVQLADGPAAPATVRLARSRAEGSTLEITLREGRKRQVKRMCEAVGHPVLKLERTAFAGLTAQGVERGTWRHLTGQEVTGLRSLVGLQARSSGGA